MSSLFKNLVKLNKLSLISRNISSSLILRDIFTIQDDQDYNQRVIKNDKLVILDFYADWCGPCKILAPRLETILGDRKDVDLAKLNVDNFDNLAAEYEISSIPTVFAIKDGKIQDRFIGVRDEDEIRTFIEKNLI